MNKKIATRTGIGLLAIVAMVSAYTMFSNWSIDPEFNKTYDTAGFIAALENTEQGTKAVLINPAGEKTDSAGYREGAIDQEITWDREGNHAYVSSNREGSEFAIYRWSPIPNVFDRRSLGNASQSELRFASDEVDDPDKKGLLISGGKVYTYYPKEKEVNLLLSAVYNPGTEGDREQSAAGGGTFGTGFLEALWVKDRKAVLTIMSQEDDTEALVVHYPYPDAEGRVRQSYPVFLGDQIQIRVAQNGIAMVAVRNFKFRSPEWPTPEPDPESVKAIEGKNLVIYLEIDEGLAPRMQPMVLLPTKEQVIWDIAVSPAGDEFVAVFAELKNGQDFYPRRLIVGPLRPPGPDGALPIAAIVEGAFTRPSWNADGTKIVALRDEDDGKRSVVVLDKDGSGLTRMTKEGLDYSYAVFSPQIPGE